MKRLIAIALVVALAVTAIAVAIPAFAAPGGSPVVYETRMINAIEGSDNYLDECGEVRVKANGDVKMEIEGAPAGQPYGVVIYHGDPFGPTFQFLGPMTEYDDGEYKFEGSLTSAFPPPAPPLVALTGFCVVDTTEPPGSLPYFIDGFWWELE